MTYPELRCDLSGPELLLPRQQERLARRIAEFYVFSHF